jgi:HEAT repeat protein
MWKSKLVHYHDVRAPGRRRDVVGLRECLHRPVEENGVFAHGVAARELARLRSVDSAPEIVPLLDDPAWEVRTDAARALFMLDHTGIGDQLILRLGEPDDAVLRYIMAALAHTRDPRAVGPLAFIIAGADEPGRSDAVRAAAARALGKIRHHIAIGPLSHALNDRSARVRLGAVKGLAALEIAAAKDALDQYSEWRYPMTTARARLGARRSF